MENFAHQSQTAGNHPRIIPRPQFQAWGKHIIQFSAGVNPANIFLTDGASKQEMLAAELIRTESLWLAQGKALFHEVPVGRATSKPSPGIYLIDWSRESSLKSRAAGILDAGDLEVLSDPQRMGQGYVTRVLPEQGEVWLVGAASQGVLYAVTTLLQLMEPAGDMVSIAEAHIRDYPDFRYREAADWLLRAEINRWAYDWGDGTREFIRRIKRKLNFCLRYKINTVFFDGFGWNSEKVPGYAQMMRELNGYARERGIKLMFGGFGSNYDPAKVQPQYNIGSVLYNRDGYPWGPIYACFGEARTPEHPFLGNCRANDALNDIKAQEMETFVRSVEPGALYIHFEDTGFFDRSQERWLARCPRCKERWPNDDFTAQDGGAGAIAHGYNVFLDVIFGVKNPDTGYEALRDCTIILIAPVYAVNQDSEEEWDRVLDLWVNAVSLLPNNQNIQIGFREIFPRKSTNQRWIDAYKQKLESTGLNSNTFVFFLGGADHYSWHSFNYPFVATAIMSGMFMNATTLYHFNGGLHQEPLQLLNAEFAWNIHAPEYLLPNTYKESRQAWESLMKLRLLPEGIFSASGFLGQACRHIYGHHAWSFMYQYFTEYVSHPHSGDELLIPILPEKLFPLSILWRILSFDQSHWDPRMTDPTTSRILERLAITESEWQGRLSRLWTLYAEITTQGQERVRQAIASPDLKTDAREDLVYLEKCLQVGTLFSELLSTYHEMLSYNSRDSGFVELLHQSEEKLRRLSDHVMMNFSFDTVCPVGGDQASWLQAILKLRNLLQIIRSDVK
ncbi:MAG: hypothetical protein HY709_04820 [Candidatus Latescibacteria bacterium]|nr:hypothetical protein [Candidatus Latescibacterota bacterium]